MYKGICPWCRLIVGKVLDRNGDGNMDDMYRGVEWVLENKERYHIRVLNISIGIGHIENEDRMHELLEIVDVAWNSGMVVVCAAGNMGPEPMTLSPLGSSKKVITVGCHDGGFYSGRSSLCESYSGRGPSPYAVNRMWWRREPILCPAMRLAALLSVNIGMLILKKAALLWQRPLYPGLRHCFCRSIRNYPTNK